MTTQSLQPSPSVPTTIRSSGPSITELCAAARAQLAPLQAADRRFPAEIESGVADLLRIVEDFERKHVVGKLPSYRADEALVAAARVGDSGARGVAAAEEGIRSERAGQASLANVPPVSDVPDALIDHELRTFIRGLTTAKLNAMLEEMRAGKHVRAMLAAARHPLPGDFDREAATLYAKFSEPTKRRAAESLIAVYGAKREAARMLIAAAEATKAVVARFAELQAAMEIAAAEQAQTVTVTRSDVPYTPSRSAAPGYRQPTAQIEGSCATRVS